MQQCHAGLRSRRNRGVLQRANDLAGQSGLLGELGAREAGLPAALVHDKCQLHQGAALGRRLGQVQVSADGCNDVAFDGLAALQIVHALEEDARLLGQSGAAHLALRARRYDSGGQAP